MEGEVKQTRVKVFDETGHLLHLQYSICEETTVGMFRNGWSR
jgi:hypothetical protein